MVANDVGSGIGDGEVVVNGHGEESRSVGEAVNAEENDHQGCDGRGNWKRDLCVVVIVNATSA